MLTEGFVPLASPPPNQEAQLIDTTRLKHVTYITFYDIGQKMYHTIELKT